MPLAVLSAAALHLAARLLPRAPPLARLVATYALLLDALARKAAVLKARALAALHALHPATSIVLNALGVPPPRSPNNVVPSPYAGKHQPHALFLWPPPRTKLRVLTQEQCRRFDETGVLVVPNAVPANLVAAARDVVFNHVGVSWPDLRVADARATVQRPSIITDDALSHCDAFWATRTHPNIRDIFADIYQTDDLLTTFDRCNFTPSQGMRVAALRAAGNAAEAAALQEKLESGQLAREAGRGSKLHWDKDLYTERPLSFAVQAVLYLTDTAENQGGLRVIPGFHRRPDAAAFLRDRKPRSFADRVARRDLMGAPFPPVPYDDPECVSVAAPAGSLVIWASVLPHGAGVNVHPTQPRVAQYLTCVPNRSDWEPRSPVSVNLCDVGTRAERCRMARERLAKFYLDMTPAGKLPPPTGDVRQLPAPLQTGTSWRMVTGLTGSCIAPVISPTA